MAPAPTVRSSAKTMNCVVSPWLVWGITEMREEALSGLGLAGVLNGVGVGLGMAVALPVETKAQVLAGVPHLVLAAALSLSAVACCSLA